MREESARRPTSLEMDEDMDYIAQDLPADRDVYCNTV